MPGEPAFVLERSDPNTHLGGQRPLSDIPARWLERLHRREFIAGLAERPACPVKGAPLKLLFVCSHNRWRSPTAEALFASVPGYRVRSAGTEAGARVRATAKMIGWADLIFCMERRHVGRLRERFAEALVGKQIVCLDIPDDYGFMDSGLIEMLRTALRGHVVLD